MSRTSKITLMPEWLRLLTDAVTDETGAEVSANTPTDTRLAFQQGCYNGAHRLASRATPRVAALELFATVFADAEWEEGVADAAGVRVCPACDGVHPEDFDWMEKVADQNRIYLEGLRELGKGHRRECLRGLAVAALREAP